MSRLGKSTLLGAVWLAAAFRFHGLFANTFHADEALFGHWARLIAVWRDPLLLTQAVDKPPLLFYLQALFYPVLGPVEWAARLPSLIASLLLIPFVGLFAWRIYGDQWVAAVTALIVAFAPLTIQFSATAFTDPLMMTLLVASLAVASGKLQVASGKLQVAGCKVQGARCKLQGASCKWQTRSGLLFGLAVATKHQAWLFFPLLAGVALLAGWQWRGWRRWLAGFIPVLVLLAVWELARSGRLALWPAQITNFGGLRPIWSWELQPRLVAWLAVWQYTAALPLLLAGIAAAAVLLVKAWRSGDRAAAPDLLFTLYLVAYSLLHWLLAIPIWDRYLLPAVPIVALVISRGLRQILDSVQRIGRAKTRFSLTNSWSFAVSSYVYPRSSLSAGALTLSLLVLLVVQFPDAWQARGGRFPVGGQPAADQGAAKVAQALAGEPYGTVLYDHWYSWQWRYHLFDWPVYVSWFPHPAALVEDLAVFGRDGNPRYLALPNTAAALPVQRAVASAGFQLQPIIIETQTDIALYQLIPVTR